MNRNLLKVPTGGRLTSWLFTKRGGAASGIPKHKSIQWQAEGFEPGSFELQDMNRVQRPNQDTNRL